MAIFKMDFEVELSTRPESFVGEIENWNRAEAGLKEAMDRRGMKYEINEGDEVRAHIKKMCLNCKHLVNENEDYRCNNEAVMEKGREKILASLPEGFEIESMVLKPMALKNPTKKCGNYDFNLEQIVATSPQC